MWPNAPQVEMTFARNHANEILREAEQRRHHRCQMISSRPALAGLLRRLTHQPAPLSSVSQLDSSLPVAGS